MGNHENRIRSLEKKSWLKPEIIELEEKMPEEREERKIEEFYQIQGKKLVDSLYDLGLLSESLSRDGMEGIDSLVALYFQQIADSAARVAGFTKRYKNDGFKGEVSRHEAEKRLIGRLKAAEGRLAELEDSDMATWVLMAGSYLRSVTTPPYEVNPTMAESLYLSGIEMGFIPAPDAGPAMEKAAKVVFGGDLGKEPGQDDPLTTMTASEYNEYLRQKGLDPKRRMTASECLRHNRPVGEVFCAECGFQIPADQRVDIKGFEHLCYTCYKGGNFAPHWKKDA